MNTNHIKIRVAVHTDKVGSEVHGEFSIDRDVWERMTDDEKEAEAREVVHNLITWHYEED